MLSICWFQVFLQLSTSSHWLLDNSSHISFHPSVWNLAPGRGRFMCSLEPSAVWKFSLTSVRFPTIRLQRCWESSLGLNIERFPVWHLLMNESAGINIDIVAVLSSNYWQVAAVRLQCPNFPCIWHLTSFMCSTPFPCFTCSLIHRHLWFDFFE